MPSSPVGSCVSHRISWIATPIFFDHSLCHCLVPSVCSLTNFSHYRSLPLRLRCCSFPFSCQPVSAILCHVIWTGKARATQSDERPAAGKSLMCSFCPQNSQNTQHMFTWFWSSLVVIFIRSQKCRRRGHGCPSTCPSGPFGRLCVRSPGPAARMQHAMQHARVGASSFRQLLCPTGSATAARARTTPGGAQRPLLRQVHCDWRPACGAQLATRMRRHHGGQAFFRGYCFSCLSSAIAYAINNGEKYIIRRSSRWAVPTCRT